ncbi:MAG: DUF2399 domain-containing protein [Acidobacteria bacterium]|nr:DUF2399 domain-containing protein [Acidobacteriota bacterium]
MDIGTALHKSVTSATAKWTKARKAAERSASAMQRYYRAPARETIREIAFAVMEQAYMKASANNTLPAAARQIMYQARPLILAAIGDNLDANYFTQTLLPDYLEEHPDKAASWDVVFDARGHLYEPHTGVKLPLGTLAVREYLRRCKAGVDVKLDEPREFDSGFPTYGTRNRFHTVLFIEKEGFAPLLERAKIAERFDLAVMSTKGVSTTAARTLIEKLGGARFLVLHDFDKAGFTIAATLKRNTRRYTFAVRPDVVDLGLRLTDVQGEDLESEPVGYKHPFNARNNLRLNGATVEETQFLVSDERRGIGRRIELNAFASDHFIEWLERKLESSGVKKVVPDDDVLTAAYRRAVFTNAINQQIRAAHEDAQKIAEKVKIPKGLRRSIDKLLKKSPAMSWDAALSEVAARSNGRRGGVG